LYSLLKRYNTQIVITSIDDAVIQSVDEPTGTFAIEQRSMNPQTHSARYASRGLVEL
jgi:hypothetical protein